MKQIESTGRKVDDAINAGLKELGVTLGEVDVKILDNGGLFRKAKVLLTVEEDEDLFIKPEKPIEKPEVKPEPKKEKPIPQEKRIEPKKENKPTETKVYKKENKPTTERKPAPQKFEKRQSADTRPAPIEAEPAKPVKTEKAEKTSAPTHSVDQKQVALATDYLKKVLSLMNITVELKTDTSHGSIDIDIVTDDNAVIGHRGEVLDALQILTKRAVEEGEDKFVHVNIDSRNYRVKREESLVALANRMAAKCIRTGKKVVLEPMSNTHRKIIHATLTDNDKVITKSEGKEPNRKVVIIPKRS